MKIKITCECGNEEEVEGNGELYHIVEFKKYKVEIDNTEDIEVTCNKCGNKLIVY